MVKDLSKCVICSDNKSILFCDEHNPLKIKDKKQDLLEWINENSTVIHIGMTLTDTNKLKEKIEELF